MTTSTYFLDEDHSNKLEITWKGHIFDIFMKNFVIRLDDQIIDTVHEQTELEKGKTYTLADNSTLNVRLDPNNLQVIYNEKELQAYHDPVDSLKTTFRLTFLLGVTLIVVGGLNILPATNNGANENYIFWQGYLSAAIGLVILFVGYLAQKKATFGYLAILGIIIILQSLVLDIFVRIVIEERFVDLLGLAVSILLAIIIVSSGKSLQNESKNSKLGG